MKEELISLQGGGIERGVNPVIKEEEMRGIIPFLKLEEVKEMSILSSWGWENS